jgi:hypothetical protein
VQRPQQLGDRGDQNRGIGHLELLHGAQRLTARVETTEREHVGRRATHDGSRAQVAPRTDLDREQRPRPDPEESARKRSASPVTSGVDSQLLLPPSTKIRSSGSAALSRVDAQTPNCASPFGSDVSGSPGISRRVVLLDDRHGIDAIAGRGVAADRIDARSVRGQHRGGAERVSEREAGRVLAPHFVGERVELEHGIVGVDQLPFTAAGAAADDEDATIRQRGDREVATLAQVWQQRVTCEHVGVGHRVEHLMVLEDRVRIVRHHAGRAVPSRSFLRLENTIATASWVTLVSRLDAESPFDSLMRPPRVAQWRVSKSSGETA